MDPRITDLSSSIGNFDFENHTLLPNPNHSTSFANGFGLNEPALWCDSFAMPLLLAESCGGSFNPSTSLGTNSNGGGAFPSSSDDDVSLDPVLKYISEMLMEENEEERLWISPDDFALQNTERSLYDAIGEQYPTSPDQLQNFDTSEFIVSPCSNFSESSNEKTSVGISIASTDFINSVHLGSHHDPGEHNQSMESAGHSLEQVPQSSLDYSSSSDASSLSNSAGDAKGSVETSVLVENNFTDNDSAVQFKRGLEEASKFLPPVSQFMIDLENMNSGSGAKRGILEVGSHGNKAVNEDLRSGSRGRKNHEREDLGLAERRATKQTASYVEAEEAELSDMLDKVLLHNDRGSSLSIDADDTRRSNRGRGRGRRKGKNNSSVDLNALLILCAQAVSSNDLRTANELLKQIRENSSPSGDGSQRSAHYFANGLEARMTSNTSGTQIFSSLTSIKISVADMLKAYQLHLSCCPLQKLSIFCMNYMILKLSQKASVLHIIDFGICFGFQWPIFIQKLGEQAGGPPKLRITGIEVPQPGFRPAESIEETGRRLARYCARFNVPFEFNALPSRNWEHIKIEDLKIESGEMIAVNSVLRLKNLLDEGFDEDSPKDAVLNLIRSINPDVFVHTVANGSYNSPFFLARFKEALFNLSPIYDMFDATIAAEHKDSEARRILESECYGSLIMNIVACEGPERVERPEPYRKWQVRHTRAGFKQLPLDQEMVKKLLHKLEAWYHKDFVLDEDGNWMLLGWKGRIMYATSCWVPV